MHLMYFTEQPMSAYSEEAGREFGHQANYSDEVADESLRNALRAARGRE